MKNALIPRLIAIFLFIASGMAAAEKSPTRPIGVARVDITPEFPVRLSGYAVRKTEATNVVQKLWTKAIAIGSDREGPALLITVDNTGVPKHVRDAVVARLHKKGLDPSRIAICSSHSHSTPYLAGYLPTLFGEPLPPEHQAHVERYTSELVDAIERVALAALKNRKPGHLAWAQGQAGFAANRRTPGGPVDHALPLLAVTDAKGILRALLVSYACHCTTLGGEFNQVCGDWAGYAQEFLERDHPGVTVLVAIGCGADANPAPRGTLALAQQHAGEIATNIKRLLIPLAPPERGSVTRSSSTNLPARKIPETLPISDPLRVTDPRSAAGSFTASGGLELTPVRGKLDCRAKEIETPFDTPPTRAEFETRAKETNYVGYHARWNLAKLDRGGILPTTLPYLVQTWNFGTDLALVFLPGEVVVDYSLRLKREFDAARFWVNAYANDVPCYIPSERILREGGYEGGGAMNYYGWPMRLAPGVEDRIVNTVHELLPKEFLNGQNAAKHPSN